MAVSLREPVVSDHLPALLCALGARSPGRARVRAQITTYLDQDIDLSGAVDRLGAMLDRPSPAWVRTQLDAIAARELRVLLRGDAGFPACLAAIPDPPLALFVAGSLPTDEPALVALVGSRRGSDLACTWAHDIAAALASAGVPIVSGLALGVDGAAHRGCLAVGGRTVAVLGAGHDHLYPRQHRRLASEITGSGAVISEYPPSTPPLRHQFPERNRIISGLCRAVVVIEAGVRSGSLITARCALEQGRDVMAVPGLPGGPASGCHRLIKAGAGLVENAADVFETLGLTAPAGPEVGSLDAWLARLLAGVGVSVVSADDLAGRLALPTATVRAGLVHLELLGFVACADGGYIRRPSADALTQRH